MKNKNKTKPKFIMVGGIPGSGKSYCANYILDLLGNTKSKIVSVDKIRKETTGSYADLSKDSFVFEKAREMATKYINQGINVIWDSTNTINYNRNLTLEYVKYHTIVDFDYYFIYLNKLLNECLYNNKNRDRICPESLIITMYNRQQIPYMSDNILVINNNNLRMINELFENTCNAMAMN